MNKLLAISGAIIIVGFFALGIHNIVTTNNEIKLREVKLKSELGELESKHDVLNKDLDKASQEKALSEEEVKRLNDEKAELERIKQELDSQHQADAGEKDDVAKSSEPQVVVASTTTNSGSVESIIAQAAAKYGVDQSMMIRLAMCESTMGKFLRNPQPVIVNGVNYGHAEGVFQFIPSTWTRMSTQAGYGGASVYDTNANINVAAWALSTGHKGEWECQ